MAKPPARPAERQPQPAAYTHPFPECGRRRRDRRRLPAQRQCGERLACAASDRAMAFTGRRSRSRSGRRVGTVRFVWPRSPKLQELGSSGSSSSRAYPAVAEPPSQECYSKKRIPNPFGAFAAVTAATLPFALPSHSLPVCSLRGLAWFTFPFFFLFFFSLYLFPFPFFFLSFFFPFCFFSFFPPPPFFFPSLFFFFCSFARH